MKEGDLIRLNRAVVPNHSCPDGRDNNATAYMHHLSLTDGRVHTNRDLHGCRHWNIEDLVPIEIKQTVGEAVQEKLAYLGMENRKQVADLLRSRNHPETGIKTLDRLWLEQVASAFGLVQSAVYEFKDDARKKTLFEYINTNDGYTDTICVTPEGYLMIASPHTMSQWIEQGGFFKNVPPGTIDVNALLADENRFWHEYRYIDKAGHDDTFMARHDVDAYRQASVWLRESNQKTADRKGETVKVEAKLIRDGDNSLLSIITVQATVAPTAIRDEQILSGMNLSLSGPAPSM